MCGRGKMSRLPPLAEGKDFYGNSTVGTPIGHLISYREGLVGWIAHYAAARCFSCKELTARYRLSVDGIRPYPQSFRLCLSFVFAEQHGILKRIFRVSTAITQSHKLKIHEQFIRRAVHVSQ